jgi:RNA polymerase-binding transcription factor DksA
MVQVNAEQHRDRLADGTRDTGAEGATIEYTTMRLAVQQLRRNTRERQVRARARLERGQYGICQVCHQPINADRLKALPYA